MAALITSLIRALGMVAVSVLLVAIVWTTYINRQSVVDVAQPIVSPLVDAAARAGSASLSKADPQSAGESSK